MAPKNAALNVIAEDHGEIGCQDTSLYQFHTMTDLSKGIMGLYGISKIKEARKLLVEKGIISEHKNPSKRYQFDHTIYYLFHPETYSKWLNDRFVKTNDSIQSKLTNRQLKNNDRSVENNDRSVENNDSSVENNGTITEITTENTSENTSEIKTNTPRAREGKATKTVIVETPTTVTETVIVLPQTTVTETVTGKEQTILTDNINRVSDTRARESENCEIEKPSGSTDSKPHTENQDMALTPGNVCVEMRKLGMVQTNPSHPAFLAILAMSGVTLQDFIYAATISVEKGKGFAYALSTVKNLVEDREREATTTTNNKPTKGKAKKTFERKECNYIQKQTDFEKIKLIEGERIL